jgi:Uma2 family endonuclease
MAMPRTVPLPGEWTVEAWRQLPDDGQRYEVIDGVLYVTPAPRALHQEAVRRLVLLLSRYLDGTDAGHVMLSPAEIALTRARVVQPDVFVAPLVLGRPPREWDEISRLVLAVEVLSPSTASRDRTTKRCVYQQHADEYWIVDLDARIIERWRPADTRPEILETTLEWQPAGADTPLTLNLPAFFRDVLES